MQITCENIYTCLCLAFREHWYAKCVEHDLFCLYWPVHIVSRGVAVFLLKKRLGEIVVMVMNEYSMATCIALVVLASMST